MVRVALVNMPFSAVEIPSIALTQLQSVVRRRFGARVEVEVCYPSHDFCKALGLDAYRRICDDATYSGLGDWLFRQVAFPDAPDNTAEFRERYFPLPDERRQALERALAADIPRLLRQVIDRYRLAEADLVGFTSMFTQNAASFALARLLKEQKPDIVIAIGGANCESPMGEEIARNVPAVDYVFSGPALLTFPELVQALLDGDRGRAARLDGVLTGANCRRGWPAQVGPLGPELDIDAEVPLDYGPFLDSFESAFAGQPVEPILLFETSRGCWWGERAHCTFCGLNGSTMKFRWMSPPRATALLRSLFSYVPRVRRFDCVDNIMPKEYPRQVFAHLDPPPGVSIFYEVKADLTEEELTLIAAGGVDSVQPGIEALASSTLTLMRKGMTAARNIQFLRHCLVHDVHPGWNLLVGFPGETEEVYEGYVRDLPRLTHLPPPSGVHTVRFDRYSPYFTQADRYGLDLHPLDFYGLIYPFDAESLRAMAYYFADRNVAAPYFTDVARWIGRLRRLYAAWAEPWLAGRPPVLCFHPAGGTTVLDTRSGARVVHEVGDLGRRILAAAASPVSVPELSALLGDPPTAALEAELARLDEKGLIFHDRQRLIGLVLPRAVNPEKLRRRHARQLEEVPV